MPTSGSTNAAYPHDEWANPSAPNATAIRTNPTPTVLRTPTLCTIGVMAGAMATAAAVTGSVARPARMALMPSAAGSWKYRLTAYMMPLMAPAPMRMASVDPTRAELRNSARSTSGALTRRSTAMNPSPAAMVTTRHPMVLTDSQPQLEPLLSAKISGASTAATSTVPAKSTERDRCTSRDSPTVASVTGMHTAAMAASIQNRPCQPVVSASTPPTSGPAAAPTAEAAPHSDTARSRASPVLATEIRLIPHARMVAPDAPWMQRPAMTPPPPCDSAIRTQEPTNSTKPPMKTRRRPKMSPSAPEVTMTAAPTREYPVTAHCSVATEVLVSALIAGSRIVTAEVLALTMSAEMQVTSRTPVALLS